MLDFLLTQRHWSLSWKKNYFKSSSLTWVNFAENPALETPANLCIIASSTASLSLKAKSILTAKLSKLTK